MYQRAANADERGWLTGARRELEEEREEARHRSLKLLIATMAENRDAAELEYIAHRLWTEAQLKRLLEGTD